MLLYNNLTRSSALEHEGVLLVECTYVYGLVVVRED